MSRFNAPFNQERIRLEKSKKTARANPEPPDLTQPKNILEKLLDIELQRLDIAVRIENERNIVFPETTVIIHDVMKLDKAIKEKDSDDDDWNIDL
jgi:hypothetical protein